jgi:RimJ/RimL family protein N-acetyltransferase
MENILFNNLSEMDFEILHKWLNTDFVKKWYSQQDWTYDEIVKKYTPYVLKQKPIESFIILYDGKKIGYIQTYFLKDYPEYNMFIQAGDDSAGIDLLIGEKEYIHKGLGQKIIRKFVKDIVFSNKYVNKCIIGPEPKNIAAIKAYEKAGFRFVKTIKIPDEKEPEYIMEILRNEIG